MLYPDDLLTSAPSKRDVDTTPHVIALDPFPSDDSFNDFSPTHLFPLTRPEELNTMNTSDDEPSSGLNGRLRPRRSAVPSPQTTKPSRKSEGKPAQEKPKRTSTPSKVLNKPDDLANKSDSSLTPHFLCPYCDKKFAAKQAISKHVRRMHSFTSKQDSTIGCLFCNHAEAEPNDVIRHMVDSHPNQYFACLNCHTRFPSTTELAEHKLNICERQKVSYRNRLRQKTEKTKKSLKTIKIDDMKEFQDAKAFPTGSFNGIVISCELKPAEVHDEADIEDNITTNLILPSSKTLGSNSVLDKNAVILLDDIQWNKRIPSNFSFHNTDADQILSRLGVVHRSPRTGESTKRDWLRTIDDATQKFEKCFDTSFYSKVASNVQENLTKFLDGSFNFNPDPDSTIKTRKWKNSVVINTAEGFPILLACEQYSRNSLDGYMPRAVAPKHKWKWDNLESDRTAMSAAQIKRDSHTNNCIITLVSSLDIWTQLCMRRKYEEKYSYSPLAKKTDKQTAIEKELKEILESREIPSSSSQAVKHKYKPPLQNQDIGFPATLGLAPSTPKYELPPAVLSGEWVRPRCFVCCACGAPTSDSRALSAHMAHRHPNAQVQHYEVVGELLLNADILKHLYVPPSQMHNRTRPLRGYRECTKCRKSITLEDLHQHMLDCAGDTPAVRRKGRYRPFGVRRRRPRLPDNRIRKKIRKDIRSRQSNQKSHMRSRPRNRTEVGDAETIRKMLADLPAKRHRVLVNPGNSVLRPRNKLDKQRTKLLMKRRLSEEQKNRRLRALKSTNYNEQVGSSANEDQNKHSLVKNDDDKPLKRTVNRVTTKCKRQNDAIKRKVALNRAKRKLKSAEQALTDNENGPVRNMPSTSGAEPHQLSIENNPQRIDVNNSSYNTRESSNRGSNGSNNGQPNNGDQPPENVGHDGDPNRSRPPVQNTPLKHSIARLTADCETHDKSVQFHHSFLVQQECNNLNQHGPTGHELLFENEAAVTRLDKPPIAGGHRGILDPYGLQKSKLNKPRKGLNDCIAMLKNKLVEPSPGLSTSQISVQCGGDDPLDAEPLDAPSMIEDKHVDTTKPAEVFSRHNMNLEMERPYDRNYEYPCENNFTTERHPLSLPYEIIPQVAKLPPEDANLIPQSESLPKQKASGATKRQSSRRRSARAVIESIPPFIPEVKPIEPAPTKRHSDRVSQRRSATQRIVVNINTEINKNEMLDMPSNDKISPRQISPKQVVNTEICRDLYIDGRSSRKLSTEQISPRYLSVNEIHKSRSRSESFSKQVSPGQAYDALASNRSAHRLISPQPGIHDIDILTATKLSPKEVSPKQVSPKQVSQISPKQISLDITRSANNQLSPDQISPKQVSQTQHDMYSNRLLQKQTSVKYYDGQSTSKLPSPSQVPPRQVSQSHDFNRLTQKAGIPVQSTSMVAPKQISPKQAFEILSYSKTSSSSFPSPRQVSLDIQTSNKLSPREMSPRQISPRLVSPRQSLDINTEMTFIRSKETSSPRYTNASTEPSQTDDLRAPVPPRVSSHSGHSHSRASSQSRSTARTSKLRSPSQPRESSSHPQGPPVIMLYAPPPPPPPPPPPAASISPQVASHLQHDSQVQQQWQTTAYHDTDRPNPPDTANEQSRTRKLSVDVYPETEFSRIPSNIPPAHASTIIEPLVSVPLDLSGKPPTESNNVSKHETSFASNYENYETLDLSNKNSSFTKRYVTDVVVDLRVRPALQGSSLAPALCSNTAQNADVITDLTIQETHDELIPKDLSVKTKYIGGVYTATSEEQRYDIQNVSNQKFIQPVEVQIDEETLETPTDLSGKLTTSSSHGDVQSLTNPGSVPITEQISYIQHEKQSTTLPKIHNVHNAADLSEKTNIHIKPDFSSDVHKVTQQTAQEISKPIENIRMPEAYDNTNSMQQSVYDSALKVPLYEMRAAMSNTADNSYTNNVTYAQTSEHSKESATVCATSTLAIYTLPSPASSSHISRHESTKPVYTLANACISVTKVDGPGVVPFTTSIPSIPSTTIASSMPVYTLAGTAVTSSVNYGSNSLLGSQICPPIISMPSSIQVSYDNASEIEGQVNTANKSLTGYQKLKHESCNITASNSEQDPETARKIAMLPKELVEILGTMPPGHRNQLLNVLPQYVSQTNTQVDGIRTTDSLTGISMSSAISRHTTFNESVIAKYETAINYQNAMVKIPSDSRYSIANLSTSQSNDNFESDVKEQFPSNSLHSSLLCTVNKSSLEDIKPPIRSSNSHSESKIEIINLDASETHASMLYNPTIIDLTEDENASSNIVLKTTDGLPPAVVVPSQATQPIVNLSTVIKPKGTNEKTSMLRAIRIKAPSERHKSMSTEVILSKSILEKDTTVTNPDSENPLNKTLAIQQSEVSSTQQQQKKDAIKFTSQMSPIPTELSTGAEEPDKIQRNISTEQNISLDDVEDKHVAAKTVLVTSSISTSDLISKEIASNEILHKNVSEHVQKESAPCVDQDLVMKSSSNEMQNISISDNLIESSTPLGKASYTDETGNINLTEKNDEDSDDDISLAVIVKQKQLGQQGAKASKRKLEQKKKKKQKHIKKTQKKLVEDNLLIEAPVASTASTKPIDSASDNDKFEDLHSKATSRSKLLTGSVLSQDDEKHTKKKNRKSRRGKKISTTNVTDSVFQIQTSPDVILDHNSVSSSCSKPLDEKLEDDSNSNKESEKILKETTCMVTSETPRPSLDNYNVSQKIYEVGKDEDKPQYSKKKDKISKDSSTKLIQSSGDKLVAHENEHVLQDSGNLELEKQQDDNKKDYKKVIEPDSCSLIEHSDTQDSIVQESVNTEGSNSDIVIESKNKQKNIRAKKPKNVDIDEYSEIHDYTVTPLRRSRRKKSLYIDGKPSELESNSIEAETFMEQKTPLTKKQLIFSKLLLDEENTVPQAHSTPVKNLEDDTTIINHSSIDNSSNVNEMEISNNTSGKNKAIKRRQSPQLKRKVKKNKSVESLKQTGEDADIDNSMQVENHIVKVDVIPQIEKSIMETETNNLNIGKEQDMDISDQTDINKSINESINQDKDQAKDNSESIIGRDIDYINKLSSSAEKRKNSESIETDQITKSKKCKFNSKETDIPKEISTTIDKIGSKTINSSNINQEVRTACYNKPMAAARRTRSKSAVVKSSGTMLYDPYDIDFDEMNERNEPIFTIKGRPSEAQATSSSYLANSKPIPKAPKKSVVVDKTTSVKQRKATIVKEVTPPIKDTEDAVFHEDFVEDVRGSISDSDDSSKSDVPLQKYVVDKEKRMSDMDHVALSNKDVDDDTDFDQGELSADKNNSNDSKSSRKTLVDCKNVDGAAPQSETEEQLRSEQFMESFGFFSERKPRKSNLLASKKISETFHIIANESDDVYFGYKDRVTKNRNENNKKSADGESSTSKSTPTANKKATKRGRKKKGYVKPVPCFCNICKREYKRPDNYLRHQMSLVHVSKLSEVELKIKTPPVHEEPNYLIAYKQYLDRLKVLTDKLAKKRKHKGSKKIKLPTVDEILADLNKNMREQQLCHRGELSRDEALFLDCCELLKESHKKEKRNVDTSVIFANACLTHSAGNDSHLYQRLILDDTKSDGDVDSITAKTILESEEVRNLENDLISGLKEAANASLNSKMNYQHVVAVEQPQEQIESLHSSNITEYEKVEEIEVVEKPLVPEVVDKPHVTEKSKKDQREVLIDEKDFVYKEKMYPDIIEDIDMFEDKFDKIKRKCRSQAAAAKHSQVVAEPNESHKARRKSEKKKGKKAKKSHQNSHVPTKGALKGFDGIKVSIPTSDINMSAIVPSVDQPTKKKKKSASKKKRDKKESESSKYDSDQRGKEITSQKKVDVYEFMDNEEAELFEFRPSTLMERFKNILSKDTPSTSKSNPADDVDDSSESASDGDDFVYMSDDYVCSDDETENSLLSCEMGTSKVLNEPKKTTSPSKRKDAVEKNAMMGKIFKHNAVRTEKKTTKSKEPVKSKANLDQLFDSLLEDEPSTSTLKSDSPRKEEIDSFREYSKLPASTYEPSSSTYEAPSRLSPAKEFAFPRKIGSSFKYDIISSTSKKPQRPSLQAEEFIFSTKKYDSEDEDYGPSTSKRFENSSIEVDYGPSTSKQYHMRLPEPSDVQLPTSKKYDIGTSKGKDYVSSKYVSSMRHEEGSYKRRYSLDKSPMRKTDEGISTSYDYGADVFEQSYDDTGVARHRARRKCTVGKQNVLAETWSSESEPERAPARPTSAESVLSTGGRKKRGRKKDSQQLGGRRGNRPFRKHDESRVSSSRRTSSGGHEGGSGYPEYGSGSSVSTGVQVSLGPPPPPGPSGLKPRPRPAPAWAPDDEQEHVQQHGWIVGDSHKKLVTMLAHAKGRKRNSDDKRHFVE